MPSNISLQSVCDYVLTQVRGAPIQDVLGVQNEPALTICNSVYQRVLQRPLTWRFNKANSANTGLGVLYWTTTQYQQDYALTNASVSNVPFVNNSLNFYPAPIQTGSVVHIPTVYNSGLVIAGGVGTCTTNWAHNFAPGQSAYFLNVGQWNAGIFTPDTSGLINGVALTITATPTSTTFTFNTAATPATYGAPGINDIGWIERCVLEDYANTATVKPRHSIEVTMNLEYESIVQPPFKISYQYTTTDSGLATGALIPSTTAWFRLWPVPAQQVWGVMTDYQLKPFVFSDLGQKWGVWPDELMMVIRQGVKAECLDFVEDPRAPNEMQQFLADLDQVRDIRDQERPSQTMFPDRPIMYGG